MYSNHLDLFLEKLNLGLKKEPETEIKNMDFEKINTFIKLQESFWNKDDDEYDINEFKFIVE